MAVFRWVLFQNSSYRGGDSNCRGLAVLPICPADNDVTKWSFNASRFSLNDLSEKAHNFELLPHSDRRVYVHVDSSSMGVGGYDSWSPNVAREYLIKSGKRYETDIIMRPIKGSSGNSFQRR